MSVVLDDALEDDSAALCLRSQIDVLGFRKITDHVEILETRREAGGKGDHVRVRFEARAVDEEGLVVAVRRHAAEAHCMLLSHDGALLLAFHANWRLSPRAPRDDRPQQEGRSNDEGSG